MELVEGESLPGQLKRTRAIEPREDVIITIHVAQALAYAWNKTRLIHRDIKPGNIFLSNAGEVKVGDLGLAKMAESSSAAVTATGVVMGTPHYISPEQARSARDVDFRSDIYSLGCTLYQMLTGQPPYSGADPVAVIHSHIHDPPPAIFTVLPQCPVPLGMLVGKMLAKSPRDRHQSHEELVADLTRAHESLVHPAPSAPVTPTSQSVAVPAKKPMTMIHAAAAAVVLVGGLLLWAPWKSGTDEQGRREDAKVEAKPKPGSESRLQAEAVPSQPAKETVCKTGPKLLAP